ncbi:MAG TPA: hypothetical protein VGG28_27535, partial [Kofleriaceae bacterium]
NQTAANFVDNANNLKPSEYAPNLKPGDMTQVLKLTYKSDNGGTLGTLTLYRYEKAGELPPDTELDPANPPKSTTEYYIVTEKTRVPGLVRTDSAQRMESDVDTVFSGKAAEGSGAGAGSAKPTEPKFRGPKPAAGSNAIAPKPPIPVAPKPPIPVAPTGAPKTSPAPAGSAH